MDFEKEIPVEDFDTDFDTEFDIKEITPIKSLRSDPPTQYFTNINSVYCKDVAGREELDELKEIVDDVPWQPLEDGYSNFWFELTEDTLSPWLNFSAKNNDAVIDWGDGSGEQALDTLTPTHTYAKAGRYIVKVKGVTGIVRQITGNVGKYFYTLSAVECNSEVTNVNYYGFLRCKNLQYFYSPNSNIELRSNSFQYSGIKRVYLPNGITSFTSNVFSDCSQLEEMTIPNTITEIPQEFVSYCGNIRTIVLPSTITQIRNNAFYRCSLLFEVHIQATTPPTLGTNVFGVLPTEWVCYVPVGTGETYKAASGWSTYADHILEEGQTPNRAMLAKFNSAKTDEPQDDMR